MTSASWGILVGIAGGSASGKTLVARRIHEALAPRVQKFEFQYRDGDDWKTLFTGTELSANFKRSFEPVTARAVRLNILDATEGPTISEITLSEK